MEADYLISSWSPRGSLAVLQLEVGRRANCPWGSRLSGVVSGTWKKIDGRVDRGANLSSS
jgi:hypothetical protein